MHADGTEETYEGNEDMFPVEGDLTTDDYVHFYEVGGTKRGPALTMQKKGRDVVEQVETLSDTAMWKQLDAYMKKTNFYPGVWFISDHGNAHLLTRPKRQRRRVKR